MNKNKIATELLKIAKELLAGGGSGINFEITDLEPPELAAIWSEEG